MNVHMPIQPHMISPLLALEIEQLSLCLGGPVVIAGHADYDALRGIASSHWAQCPLLLARVSNAADVADVVDFARRNQIELAVRSGGLPVSGHGSDDVGVVIDLRDLDSLEIDLAAMTVWAGSGLTAGEVSRALDKHGVAVGFEDSGALGVGDATLGGGMGHLTRKFGPIADALIGAEIVTAAGSVLSVSATSYPELFWALRDGGQFGIVTRFCYRLNPLPEFTGGPLVLPASAETLARFVSAAKDAPDALTTTLLAMPAPGLPFLPDGANKTVLMGLMAYAGPPEEARLALAPFRALTTPIADLVRPGPYSSMYKAGPTPLASMSVRQLSKTALSVDEAAEILARLEGAEATGCMVRIRVLGGAAKGSELCPASMLIDLLGPQDEADGVANRPGWSDAAAAALGATDARGARINFRAARGEDMIRVAYTGPAWQRLLRVKQTYDPTNLFRHGPGIARR